MWYNVQYDLEVRTLSAATRNVLCTVICYECKKCCRVLKLIFYFFFSQRSWSFSVAVHWRRYLNNLPNVFEPPNAPYFDVECWLFINFFISFSAFKNSTIFFPQFTRRSYVLSALYDSLFSYMRKKAVIQIELNSWHTLTTQLDSRMISHSQKTRWKHWKVTLSIALWLSGTLKYSTFCVW